MKSRILVIAALAVLTVWSCKESTKTKEAPQEEINELPYLSYKTLDGTLASTRSLPGSSILILFNTECDHCQREAEEISQKSDAFKNYELLFIASDSVHHIKSFADTYHLDSKPNVKFGRAEVQDVIMNFGAISTPAIFVYSRERKFVKSFLGETPVEELIKYL